MNKLSLIPALLASQVDAAQVNAAELDQNEAAWTQEPLAAADVFSEQYQDFIQPAECHIDTEQFPIVTAMWSEMEGPLAKATEPSILFGQQIGQQLSQSLAEEGSTTWGDIISQPIYQDEQTVVLDREETPKFVEVVVAIDVSGSMGDNKGLTEAVIKQVRAKNPDARINIEELQYSETGVTGGSQITSYGFGRGEEQHLTALSHAISILEKIQRRALTSKHVFLITDEGEKNNGDIARTIEEANSHGIHIHLLYDPFQPTRRCIVTDQKAAEASSSRMRRRGGSSCVNGRLDRGFLQPVVSCCTGYEPEKKRSNEDFTTLQQIAKSTRGAIVEMTPSGRIPNIFQTEAVKARYGEIQFTDAWPYTPGERAYYITNGEGAVCKVDINEGVIEQAILEERLPETEDASGVKSSEDAAFTGETQPNFQLWNILNSASKLGIGILALLALAGTVANNYFRSNSRRKEEAEDEL